MINNNLYYNVIYFTLFSFFWINYYYRLNNEQNTVSENYRRGNVDYVWKSLIIAD